MDFSIQTQLEVLRLGNNPIKHIEPVYHLMLDVYKSENINLFDKIDLVNLSQYELDVLQKSLIKHKIELQQSRARAKYFADFAEDFDYVGLDRNNTKIYFAASIIDLILCLLSFITFSCTCIFILPTLCQRIAAVINTKYLNGAKAKEVQTVQTLFIV